MKRTDKIFGILNRMHDVLLLLVLITAVLISGYCLYDSLYIYYRASDSELTKYKPGTSDSAAGESPITDEMVGWITIDGTDIDFPVMQGKNNLTFLNKDPYGNFSLSGSIFLDSRNSPDFSDGYSLIYGHHMEYGRMFGTLDAFLDEDYAGKHRCGTLMIGRDGNTRLDITVSAVMRVSAKERRIFDVDNPDATWDFIISNSRIKPDEPHSRIIALTTCYGNDDDMRIVVICLTK